LRHIYLAVCGAGHMGQRALCVLPQLRRVLRGEDIEVHLYSVVEPKRDAYRSIQGYLDALLLTPVAWNPDPAVPGESEPFPDLEQCLRHFREVPPDDEGPLLVYDASPTQYHSTNLGSCLENRREGCNVHFLSEKPLVIDRHELDYLTGVLIPAARKTRLRVFTDFIETQSSVLSAATLKLSNDLGPFNFAFWREGPGGFKKLLDPKARRGVQGGALLDKAVHDLSILHAFLVTTRQQKNEASVSVKRAVLLPNDIDILLPTAFRPPFAFMAARGRPLTMPRQEIDQIEHEACDALVEFSLRMPSTAPKAWTANFVSSWLGAEPRTREALSKCGIDWKDCLGSVPISLFGTSTHVPVTDSRLCLIEGARGDRLLLDFLYKDSADPRTKLFLLRNGAPPERIDFTADLKHRDFEYNSLGQSIATACRAVLGLSAPLAPFIDEDATVWVHSELMAVRAVALALAEVAEPAESAHATLLDRLTDFLPTIQNELRLLGVILDLDNTVFRTVDAVPNLEPIAGVFADCFSVPFEDHRADILRQSPGQIVDQLFAEQKQRPGKDIDEVKRIFQDAYAALKVVADLDARVFANLGDFLQLLAERGVKLALVTSGVWILQARKIHLSGIAKRCHPILIDDALAPLGKPHAFEAIAKKWRLRARNILVLGDNERNELTAARELGMRAAHFTATRDRPCECGALLHASAYGDLIAAIGPWLPSPGVASTP
jgi:FMN phosphatase YigB (HAD superfamily)/predicted dehydrogenase